MANEQHDVSRAEEQLEPQTGQESVDEPNNPQEPPAEVSSMPVIRPAVTLPNPDVEARQMAPQVTEPETAPTEPVPTSVLAASDDTETVAPLREPPKPEQEAAYVQEKTAPHTRKFPALTTWRQAFQGLRIVPKPKVLTRCGSGKFTEEYAPYTEALPTRLSAC